MNVALADSRAWVVCGYDSRSLASAIVDDARRTHPRLAVGTASEISADFTEPASYYASRDTPLTPYPTAGVEWIPIHPDLAPIRQFVADHAPRFGVAADRIDDYILAVNEIATNVLRHGGGKGEARMWATDRRVVCEIIDTGTATGNFLGFLRADPHSERGHGLWIARQICDLLEMRTGSAGTTVRLHMRRSSRRVHEAVSRVHGAASGVYGRRPARTPPDVRPANYPQRTGLLRRGTELIGHHLPPRLTPGYLCTTQDAFTISRPAYPIGWTP